jgi:hypothetical protein
MLRVVKIDKLAPYPASVHALHVPICTGQKSLEGVSLKKTGFWVIAQNLGYERHNNKHYMEGVSL